MTSDDDIEELERARYLLRVQMIEPLWRTAPHSGPYAPESQEAFERIQQVARQRVFGFLADRLDMPFRQCRIDSFDLETCRAAWRALRGIAYADIRNWYKTTKRPGKRKERAR